MSARNRDRLHAETFLDLTYARDLVVFVHGGTREGAHCQSVRDLVFLNYKLAEYPRTLYPCKLMTELLTIIWLL